MAHAMWFIVSSKRDLRENQLLWINRAKDRWRDDIGVWSHGNTQ